MAPPSGASLPCEGPRPHAWSMCAAWFCPCISLSRGTPLGRSRYQILEFPTTSEFPTELLTHVAAAISFELLIFPLCVSVCFFQERNS